MEKAALGPSKRLIQQTWLKSKPTRKHRFRPHLCVFICSDEAPGIAAAFANASFAAAALAKTCRTAAAVINASLGIGTGSSLAPVELGIPWVALRA